MDTPLFEPSRPVNHAFSGPVWGYPRCPGFKPDGAIHALPQLNLNADRQAVLDYFDNTWAMTEVLFSGLAVEDAFYRAPYHGLRHPLIFYYAHTVAVFINKLRVAGLLDGPLNAEFERLFEVGVDEMRWDDLHEGNPEIWPPLSAVQAYRREGYALIRHLIETHPGLEAERLPITQQSPLWALVMGFEHERIHFETSSVLIRELPIEWVRRPAEWPASPASASPPFDPLELRLVDVEEQEVILGKPRDWPAYGWDNEYGAETRKVPAFCASDALITNAQFLEFVKDGGYANAAFWSSEAWAWRSFRNLKWPTFWVQDGPAGSHLYRLRTIFETIDFQPDWPVCVNHHEAKAYCAWLSARHADGPAFRLITEAEHHALRGADLGGRAGVSPRDPVLDGDIGARGWNLNLAFGSEGPVRAAPANDRGFHDVFGNLWQWCEDHFHPLTGFAPHPYYDDFSAPCFDGRHHMILGGSFASTGHEASIWSRFHFRPHFFQHAGFRVARGPMSSVKRLLQGSEVYETEAMLGAYLLTHFGAEAEIFEDSPLPAAVVQAAVHLPVACAEITIKHATHFERALDLGCAVGRSTFELARRFSSVTGIDFSHEFVAAAQALKTSGELEYWRKDGGSTRSRLTARPDPGIDRARVKFEQGDACALPHRLGDFDAVLMANLICRLPDPGACLRRMQGPDGLVRPGGVLVITTPFSWLEDYTPKARWIDGIEGVGGILSEFDLLETGELPFMIRDHRRRFEFIITQLSVWRRR
jgi:5-histidylcysteine sulfoxide synthase/putative 4-mercaptohistidine N1-methyltranferase